ncbi:hypothetical protein HWI79_3583 [Cryptosporidium felis]|nr:hypothetical protein HWI79_3583 [Cryptosporidium felis]
MCPFGDVSSKSLYPSETRGRSSDGPPEKLGRLKASSYRPATTKFITEYPEDVAGTPSGRLITRSWKLGPGCTLELEPGPDPESGPERPSREFENSPLAPNSSPAPPNVLPSPNPNSFGTSMLSMSSHSG